MKVTVTQDDIKRGKACSGSMCPVALAISRTVPPKTSIDVGCHIAVIGDKHLNLPPEAVDFVDKFDSRCLVAPFEFQLPDLTIN